jgi:hypothetical protein
MGRGCQPAMHGAELTKTRDIFHRVFLRHGWRFEIGRSVVRRCVRINRHGLTRYGQRSLDEADSGER